MLLLESEGEIGGSMLQSAGMFTAAGTSVQAAMGVEDSVDRFFQHYMDLNQWRLQPGLVRRFCTRRRPPWSGCSRSAWTCRRRGRGVRTNRGCAVPASRTSGVGTSLATRARASSTCSTAPAGRTTWNSCCTPGYATSWWTTAGCAVSSRTAWRCRRAQSSSPPGVSRRPPSWSPAGSRAPSRRARTSSSRPAADRGGTTSGWGSRPARTSPAPAGACWWSPRTSSADTTGTPVSRRCPGCM